MSKAIGGATFVLTLGLALLGHRQESFDEPGRNLVAMRETRSEIAANAQVESTRTFGHLAPLEKFMNVGEARRVPSSLNGINLQ